MPTLDTSRLKFVRAELLIQELQASFYPPSGIPLYAVVVDGKVVGTSVVRRISALRLQLELSLEPSVASLESVACSLVHVSMIRIQDDCVGGEDVVVEASSSFDLSRIGFMRTQSGYETPIDAAVAGSTRALRDKLREAIEFAPHYGQGYLIDVSRLKNTQTLERFNSEYNAIAWGPAGWALHSAIASDEREIIDRYVSGQRAVEIGTGSGRVLGPVAQRVGHLTATDSVSEIVGELGRAQALPNNCSVLLDDIRDSKLPSQKYDLVVWWENGLGGLLDKEQRALALCQVGRLLVPGGRAILGLRNLVPLPADHLMPSSRCADVMGIYHTFTKDEVVSLLPADLAVSGFVGGGRRPAGGNQFYLLLRKNG